MVANSNSASVLNRLLVRLHRSLQMYLTQAAPWLNRGADKAALTLQNIVADQQRLAQLIADLLIARRIRPETGDFPIDFTDMNFLSIEFLSRELATHARSDVEWITRAVATLEDDAEAKSLAEEALGSAKAHLEQLEELATQAV